MGLSTEMKTLSEDILASFKNRIKENEELVIQVQKTLDGFKKDHQEMTAVLNANAAALRAKMNKDEKNRLKDADYLMKKMIKEHLDRATTLRSTLDKDEKIRMKEFNALMKSINAKIAELATSTRNMLSASEADRLQEFADLMKNINLDITNINADVMSIFQDTNDMLDRFDKEHLEMSAELRADLSKNLMERVQYTRTLLTSFQKRLSDISKENQKMAQKLRKDLANGEAERLSDYNNIMKGIHQSIKGICKDVKDIQKATSNMMHDYKNDREGASAEWNKMQDAIAKLRKTGVVAEPKQVVKKVEKKEVIIETPVIEALFVEEVVEVPVIVEAPKEEIPMTLEDKVLDFINKHPHGVKISEMEEPLGETRMKLGFVAKNLLDLGEIQKVDKHYFPLK